MAERFLPEPSQLRAVWSGVPEWPLGSPRAFWKRYHALPGVPTGGDKRRDWALLADESDTLGKDLAAIVVAVMGNRRSWSETRLNGFFRSGINAQ